MVNKIIQVIGIITSTIGLAYAFAEQNTSYLSMLLSGQYGWQYIFLGFPHLISGIIIFLGGISIRLLSGSENNGKKEVE